MYADHAGCMISEVRNFSNDFGLLFTVLIGLYRSEVKCAGLQSTITSLSGPEGTPLQPSDFDTCDKVVRTGAMMNISRPITPLQVLVKLTLTPAEHVAVYAHGFNLMERPMAIDEGIARSLDRSSSQQLPLRTRPSISRLAKSKGMEKTRAIIISQLGEISAAGNSNFPRRFAPRSIFGSGMVRYRCVFNGNVPGAEGSTLQLSWQPKCHLSEALSSDLPTSTAYVVCLRSPGATIWPMWTITWLVQVFSAPLPDCHQFGLSIKYYGLSSGKRTAFLSAALLVWVISCLHPSRYCEVSCGSACDETQGAEVFD